MPVDYLLLYIVGAVLSFGGSSFYFHYKQWIVDKEDWEVIWGITFFWAICVPLLAIMNSFKFVKYLCKCVKTLIERAR